MHAKTTGFLGEACGFFMTGRTFKKKSGERRPFHRSLYYLSPNTRERKLLFLLFLAEAAHSADLDSACFTL